MPTKVAPGVVQERLAHSKVLYLTDENLLVDTGPESEWAELQVFLNEMDNIEQLFISHTHGDHIGNLERVVETYQPDIFFPENEPIEDIFLSEDEITRVSDDEILGSDVQVVQVPGHSPGICALYLPERKVLLATDVLDGADRRGLPANYLLPPPAMFNWDTQQAEENLKKLLDLEFDTVIVTHGSNIEENALIKLKKYLNFPEYYRQQLLED
ncbi:MULTISPECIES: MBL fold metallo-hydrolase [Haloferacaceae]|uniref:MBL fold metallo-hydrolase n=1 Tax=Halorubrum glutamatedens TaxID=2707018 RepID=A0ABD5QNC9_9EURY|nr:MBL fold metallo-hydrolase [Halobellus captivus]